MITQSSPEIAGDEWHEYFWTVFIAYGLPNTEDEFWNLRASSEEPERAMPMIKQTTEPYILEAEASYLVVFKPPRLHSVPLHSVRQGKTEAGVCPTNSASDTSLLDWCAAQFAELRRIRGKHPWEGGVLHRLDYEAHGLILIARTQEALDALSAQQEAGLFVKDYTALSVLRPQPLGFPQTPSLYGAPCIIESGFRPFGPGRKAVRPVVLGKRAKELALDQGKPYQTEIVETYTLGDCIQFKLRLRRGFRHQIRCHLAWLGYPILNDALYGGATTDGTLCLHAHTISFLKPGSGIRVSYSSMSLKES
ncbi:MAG: RNA pseudouridine synthase [Treponema sp.]|jgi:23S rRNA pseudouridine1911/1915/1917 synthase|nr:RNA pseudouridine synthase [Treponema sp.]